MSFRFNSSPNTGIQGDYTSSLRNLGAQAPKAASQFATKTGALEPTTTAALIGAGAGILNTLLGYALSPDPYVPEEKSEVPELAFRGKKPVDVMFQTQDPGVGSGAGMMMGMNTSTNIGAGSSPREIALNRVKKHYQVG